MELDPESKHMEAVIRRNLLGGRRAKQRKQPRKRREPLQGTAALFAEYLREYGGYGYYDRDNTDDQARELAYKWGQALKSEKDAEEFLRLGGRPSELWILEQWDAQGLPRSLLARVVTQRVSGEEISVIELIRFRRFTVPEVARHIARWQHRGAS